MKSVQEQIKKLPDTPGVYIFKNDKEKVIYVGKAANLKRRVGSYFSGKAAGKPAIIYKETKRVEFEKTGTVIEALIIEANLIKKFSPKYNVKEKDDRSFLYLVITKDDYPRVLLQRGRGLNKKNVRSVFGPFIFSSEIRSALRIVRKIFPFSTHTKKEIEGGRPCFYRQINLCPGTCAGEIGKKKYLKEVRNIELFFKGKKKKIVSNLKKEMKRESENMEYEKAGEIKRKINLLSHIQDIAVLKKEEKEEKVRIEGYDVSNISGSLAAGAMVVFEGNFPRKKEYRKFKIRSIKKPDDIKMLKEVAERRLKNDWKLPHLILVDGGKGQVSAVEDALKKEGLDIPVVGIAKGKNRKKEEVVGRIPSGIKKETLVKVRDEAHRFAVAYHKNLRKKEFL